MAATSAGAARKARTCSFSTPTPGSSPTRSSAWRQCSSRPRRRCRCSPHHRGRRHVDYSLRRFPRLRSTFAHALFLHRLFPTATWTDELVRDPRRLRARALREWVSGACVLVRRSVLEELGGFDEGFFMYCEDIDLCRRIWDAGHDLRSTSLRQRCRTRAAAPLRGRRSYLCSPRAVCATRRSTEPACGRLERAGVALGALTASPSLARGARPGRASAGARWWRCALRANLAVRIVGSGAFWPFGRRRQRACEYRLEAVCGICGVVQVGGEPRPVVAPRSPRPDDRRDDPPGPERPRHLRRADGVALGVRRLSIVDVEGGHQPFANEDGSIWASRTASSTTTATSARARRRVTGSQPLRHRDPAAPLRGVREPLPEQLRGKFGIAVWDGASGAR